jgi:outer membrane immunogenic protein
MKRMLIAGALALAAGGQALAADLPPAPAPPPPRAPATYIPPPPPVYNWGGIYVGINGGGGFGTSNWSDPNNGALGGSTGNFDMDGYLVGGTLGANFQTGEFVFGVEADFDYNTIGGTVTPNNGFCNNTNGTQTSVSCETTSDWLSTVRGRVGYAMDRALIFGTGGLAIANVQTGITGGTISPVTYQSNVELGWTVGGGVEYAFTDNFTARVEYLFVDLGNSTCNVAANCGYDYTASGLPTGPANDSVKYYANIIRAGVNFKFGGF